MSRQSDLVDEERVLKAVAGESSAWDAPDDWTIDKEIRGESCGDDVINLVEFCDAVRSAVTAQAKDLPARAAGALWRVGGAAVGHARSLIADATGAVSRESLRRWALEQWRAEVEHRPLQNIYRPVLDSVWRQVYELATGGALLPYPAHAELVARAAEGKP